jgi:hypothetical protein
MKHRQAVGPAEKFDQIGQHQLDVCRMRGLLPEHKLLDIGCGCLRAGVHLIRYLNPDCYVGLDANWELVEAGIKEELSAQQLSEKRPRFMRVYDFGWRERVKGIFDFSLAHSIFTHCPQRAVRRCLSEAAATAKILLFTFNAGEKDYDLPVWTYPASVSYTPEFMRAACQTAGLTYEELPIEHPTGQQWVESRPI